MAGVEFTEENGGGPGVRLRKRQQKKGSGSPGNELDEIRARFAPTEKQWLLGVPQVILGRSTLSREAKKTRPTKQTQFLGRAEAATNRIEHQGFVGLAGTPLKKNESSPVPSLSAVRNGGSSLCPSAKAPTVMPTRNTATADEISMRRLRHEEALLRCLFRDFRARQNIPNSLGAGYLSIANSQYDPRFRPSSRLGRRRKAKSVVWRISQPCAAPALRLSRGPDRAAVI